MKINKAGLTAIVAATGLLSVATASNAAVGGQHDNSNFWEGAYAGFDLGVAKPSVTNHWRPGAYVFLDSAEQTNHRNRIDGAGAAAGIHLGFSQVEKNMMFGKDWLWGIEAGYMPTKFRNSTLYEEETSDGNVTASSEQSIYEINSLSTVRAKMGIFIDNVVVVGSAGISLVDSRFGATTQYTTGASNTGTFIGFNRVNPLLGIAAHYKVADTISFKLAVDHHFLYERRNTANLGGGESAITGQDSYVRQNGLTTAYIGMSYHFS